MSIRLIWPGPAVGVKSWTDYLPRGFREIGAEVVIDPSRWELLDPKYCTYPALLEVGKRAVNIWYDIDDFPVPNHDGPSQKKYVHVYEEKVRGPKDFYFKIQMPLGFDAPHAFPICQIALGSVLDSMTQLYARRRTRVFQYDVAAMFRATDFGDRNRAAVAIKERSGWKSIVTVSPRKLRPEPDGSVRVRLPIQRMEYLHNMACSRVCVALPGVGADWTWRHTEIWAIGACMATCEPLYKLPGDPTGIFATFNRDQSDMLDVIDGLIQDVEASEAIALRGHEYFLNYASPAAQARYILGIVAEGLA